MIGVALIFLTLIAPHLADQDLHQTTQTTSALQEPVNRLQIKENFTYDQKDETTIQPVNRLQTTEIFTHDQRDRPTIGHLQIKEIFTHDQKNETTIKPVNRLQTTESVTHDQRDRPTIEHLQIKEIFTHGQKDETTIKPVKRVRIKDIYIHDQKDETTIGDTEDKTVKETTPHGRIILMEETTIDDATATESDATIDATEFGSTNNTDILDDDCSDKYYRPPGKGQITIYVFWVVFWTLYCASIFNTVRRLL